MEKARYASGLRPAFFFGAPHPFLWARPKKWGGKEFFDKTKRNLSELVYKGLPLFRPAARRPRYARRRSLLAAHRAALCHRTQSGALCVQAQPGYIFHSDTVSRLRWRLMTPAAARAVSRLVRQGMPLRTASRCSPM